MVEKSYVLLPPLYSSFYHQAVLIFTEVNLVSIFFQVCGFSQGDGISREKSGRANGAAKDKVYTLECLFSFPFHLFFNVVTICIEAASASTAYRIGSVV